MLLLGLLVSQVSGCTYYPPSAKHYSGSLSDSQIQEFMTQTEGPNGLLTWETYWVELIRHGNEPAVMNALREAAEHSPSLHTRLYSNTALFQLGDRPDSRLLEILKALESSSSTGESNLARSAIRLRPGVDDEYLPWLILLRLSADNQSTRFFLSQLMSRFPDLPDTTASVLQFTAHDDLWVRAHAATALGELASSEPSILLEDGVLSSFKALLEDREREVRIKASTALVLFAQAGKGLPSYENFLLEPEVRQVRANAVEILKSASADISVPALIALLNDPDPVVQLLATRMLGTIGAEASEAIPALHDLLESNYSVEIRQAAREAISQIESPIE